MTFESLNLIEPLNKALKDMKYFEPTPVQLVTIPKILQGNDILGIAQTGTGKTAAFGLPLVQLLAKDKTKKALILAPTKELATQIGENIKLFSQHTNLESLTLVGRVTNNNQLEELKKEPRIIIATVGRIIDLLEDKTINLEDFNHLVLDEADKMIDSSGIHYIRKILKSLPKKRQTMFFSATITDEIEELSKEILDNPSIIEINKDEINTKLIKQYVLFVKDENKFRALLEILNKKEVKSALIFTNSRASTDNLVRFLKNNQVKSFGMHSNKSDVHRKKVIEQINSRKLKYLVATDIASRGLDIDSLTHVINFELPTKENVYIHRIGRTARAGKSGIAYSLCGETEKLFLDRIEKHTNSKLILVKHEFHSHKVKNSEAKVVKISNKPKRQKVELSEFEKRFQEIKKKK